MKLTILGTGNATVTKCYNTCFTISENDRYFLIDAGGGNGILRILEDKKIPLSSIHDVFVSHGHTDHLLGIIWIIRMIGQSMNSGKYQGDLNVYCHKELAEKLNIKNLLLYHTEDKHIQDRKALYTAEGQPYYSGNLFVPDDGEEIEI